MVMCHSPPRAAGIPPFVELARNATDGHKARFSKSKIVRLSASARRSATRFTAKLLPVSPCFDVSWCRRVSILLQSCDATDRRGHLLFAFGSTDCETTLGSKARRHKLSNDGEHDKGAGIRRLLARYPTGYPAPGGRIFARTIGCRCP